MTDQEKQTTLNVATWCIDRIRAERTRAMAEIRPEEHDYVPALGDVCMKLEFLADWVRKKGEAQ